MSIALGVQAMNLNREGNIAGMGKNRDRYTVALYGDKKNCVSVRHHFKDDASLDTYLESMDPRHKNGKSKLRKPPSYTVSDNAYRAIIMKVRM